MKPTEQIYNEIQQAYDHFNDKLFDGELPPCLLTLQREKNTYGYFSASRFVAKGQKVTDEIALNPTYFAVCEIEEIMQTIVHEMTHLWQHHFGSPGRGRYHNSQWADKMDSIGLAPSSTGKPGGKRTGDQMLDYKIPGGKFEQACNALFTENFIISWADRFPAKTKISQAVDTGNISTLEEELSQWGVSIGTGSDKPAPKQQTRAKFTCPKCSANAWGKPTLNLFCGDCNIAFEKAT